jgi:hypothetical protein
MCRDIASCKRHLRGISHSRHSLRLLAAADDVFDEPAMSPIGPTRRSCLSAYGGFRSKQTQKLFGRPPRPAGARSISRPSDRTTEPASGLGPFGSQSLRQEFGGIRYARFHDANNQDWSHCRLHAAPWQPHQLISGRAPSARTKILHTRGSSAPRRMGLVSRTADKANPASSVTHPSRLWPGSVGQTRSIG